ncbi:SixA phosphatase family protein [Shewanella japonica]|uniref:Phosphoglycerate mutase n=1 Tax=Shewanella japonica TaxID=93973 RepID=A0ABM6JK56_9GAMM|nr:phosphoglycerate mutase family protein [Shewanella japonica]ARD22615.1 Phosphoglycerate mutase [Shewanella japonica]
MDNNYKKELNRRYITGLLMTFGLLVILTLMVFSSGLIAAETTVNESKTKTLILVRHAEKLSGKDPQLSKAGQQRAHQLAHLLSSVSLSAIYSTNYKRTQLTAKPTADSQKLPITSYDPKELASFSQLLTSSHDNHILIVGHSNTTPALVDLLGGESGKDIDEATEYDRVYILTIESQDNTHSTSVSTLVLRY